MSKVATGKLFDLTKDIVVDLVAIPLVGSMRCFAGLFLFCFVFWFLPPFCFSSRWVLSLSFSVLFCHSELIPLEDDIRHWIRIQVSGFGRVERVRIPVASWQLQRHDSSEMNKIWTPSLQSRILSFRKRWKQTTSCNVQRCNPISIEKEVEPCRSGPVNFHGRASSRRVASGIKRDWKTEVEFEPSRTKCYDDNTNHSNVYTRSRSRNLRITLSDEKRMENTVSQLVRNTNWNGWKIRNGIDPAATHDRCRKVLTVYWHWASSSDEKSTGCV